MFNQNLSLMSIISTFVNSMTKSLFLLYQYMLNHSVLTYQIILTRILLSIILEYVTQCTYKQIWLSCKLFVLLLEICSMYFAENYIIVKLKRCVM